jgi:hypothetical protein
MSALCHKRTFTRRQKKDRLAAVFPKIIARSAGALGQAGASSEGKVGPVARRARGDLQCFIRNVEGKYLFFHLPCDVLHGIDPPLWFASTNSVVLADFGH